MTRRKTDVLMAPTPSELATRSNLGHQRGMAPTKHQGWAPFVLPVLPLLMGSLSLLEVFLHESGKASELPREEQHLPDSQPAVAAFLSRLCAGNSLYMFLFSSSLMISAAHGHPASLLPVPACRSWSACLWKALSLQRAFQKATN